MRGGREKSGRVRNIRSDNLKGIDSLKVQESSLKMTQMLVFCMDKTMFLKLVIKFD